MQDEMGREAHRDVNRHGIFEISEAHRARQQAAVVLHTVAFGRTQDGAAGACEPLREVGVRGKHRAWIGVDRPRAWVWQFMALAANMRERKTQVCRPRAPPSKLFVGVIAGSRDHRSVPRSSFLNSMVLVWGLCNLVLPISIALPPRDEDHTNVLTHVGH